MYTNKLRIANTAGGHQFAVIDETDPSGRDFALVYNRDENSQQRANELAKRWNVHLDLIRQLDNLLTQYEDSGAITDADLGEARDLLVRIGFDDKALGALADHHENDQA